LTSLRPQVLDSLLSEAIAAGDVPGVVAVVGNRGGILYARVAGARAVDPPRAMEIDSVFRIASMTKLVTALAVMMLVEEHDLDLDAPFADYVPGYKQPEVLQSFDAATRHYTTRPAGGAITIRQLLTHTSGYGYWFMDAPLLALTQGRPELLNPPFLMHMPGRKFSYSSSTDVVGQIIAPVAGMPLEIFFERRIFAPLGMVDTGYALPRDPTRLVTIQARRHGAFVEQPNEHAGVAQPTGGTGLYSTAPDYLKLLRLFLTGGILDGRRLLRRELLEAITQNQIGDLFAEGQIAALRERSNDLIFLDGSQKFGFGVMIETRDRPAGRSAGTYSWGGIYNTYFWVDPRADLAAVLLMQTTPFADPTSIELLERFEHAVYG
jgi:CubicO group peptidase (beta-lactamase class C family)